MKFTQKDRLTLYAMLNASNEWEENWAGSWAGAETPESRQVIAESKRNRASYRMLYDKLLKGMRLVNSREIRAKR